ncbi:SH3 domain-containing protein [Candidatus Pelagibacter communis]|uniref:SH3 domain-containing protein n=1 Tax=Pelagibacter ubique TaxID=198252 RepID=UPI00094D1233|nr:SH3 domain-containing protein [Candidatus Pelagibacter ubique]
MKKFLILIIIWTFFPLNVFSQEIFLSLKKNKVNVRYGPSFDFPVKYIYEKKNLPIKQIDKKENFRRIIDHKKNSGWIHVSQLKKINSVIAMKDKIMFKKPTFFSKPIAKIKEGRLLIVQKCELKWCKVRTEDLNGWINKDNLWGTIK